MACDAWQCGNEATVFMPTPGLLMRPGALLPPGIKARRDESLSTVATLRWCATCWALVQQGQMPQVGHPSHNTETIAAMLDKEEVVPCEAWGDSEEGVTDLTAVLAETMRKIEVKGDKEEGEA